MNSFFLMIVLFSGAHAFASYNALDVGNQQFAVSSNHHLILSPHLTCIALGMQYVRQQENVTICLVNLTISCSPSDAVIMHTATCQLLSNIFISAFFISLLLLMTKM